MIRHSKHVLALQLESGSAGHASPGWFIQSLMCFWALALILFPLRSHSADPVFDESVKPPAPGEPSPSGRPQLPPTTPTQPQSITNAPVVNSRRGATPPKDRRAPVFDESVPPPAADAPSPPPPTAQPADFRQVPMIRGIVIINSLKEFNPDGVPLRSGLTVTNNPLLETAQFERLTSRFMSQPMNEAKMRELQREIILYYRQHDRPLVDVLYPEQDVSNGMLQIILIEGRLKDLKVQDKQGKPYTNGWSGVKFVQDSIQLRTNDVIAESKILEDLDWLNRNPFRKVEAVYVPDRRDYGYTTVLLRVDEHRPWSVDVGYEDSGTRITSEDRITVGATWGKAFGLMDNQFRYAFTFDPSLELLRVHSASYYLPLPWRHGLRFSGYYLDVKGDVDKNVSLTGSAYQTSGRYEVPLTAIGKYQHEVSLGLDFKKSENNLFFGALSAANTPTEIFQIAGGYTSVLPDPWGRTSFSAQGYYSPGGVTDLNSDKAFELVHQGASATYIYGRINLERLFQLPGDFSWIVRGIAQISDGNLLPSEQLGLGGYATARGYDERESNGDEGFFISNELRTPALSLLPFFTKKTVLEERLQLLGFWDYGETQNVELNPGESRHVWFSSVGAGLRYKFTQHLALRFDYGWQLIRSDAHFKNEPDSRGHIGVVATY